MQIEEAKQDLKDYIEEDPFYNGTYTPETDFEKYCHNHCKAIDTVLNYIDTMHKEFDRLEGIEDNTAMLKQELIEAKEHNRQLAVELEKKDKIINEMAEYLDKEDVTETFCEGKLDVECVSECRSCIIEYFTKKVEKEGK